MQNNNSKVAIEVSNIGKCYRIGRKQVKPGSPYLQALQLLSRPLRYLADSLRSADESELLWALQDISFTVEHGEVLGVIGRNGAGKSTLLKILSRVTAPSTGEAAIHGRVASLLEVGTGFHPEMTGRENIYLSGSILGMSKQDIAENFDKIVAFAGTEKFLDTPVKRYSSGMYVRLGFAVAAHLTPEILLIDEVLAVGDAGFQQQCLQKMDTFSQSERTVLFVSHNIPMVRALCNRVIWIDKGRIVADGEPDAVITRYMDSTLSSCGLEIASSVDLRSLPREIDQIRMLERIRILDENGAEAESFTTGAKMRIVVDIAADTALSRPGLIISVFTTNGIRLFTSATFMQGGDAELPQNMKRGRVELEIPSIPMTAGDYYISLQGVARHQVVDSIQNVAHFRVLQQDLCGTGRPPENHHGLIWSPGTLKSYPQK